MPFDGTKENLLDGPAHFLYAPISETRPTKIADAFDPVTQTPAGSWVYGGYTEGGISYSRGFESNEYEVDQLTTAVLEKIVSTLRSLTVNFAEHTPELTKIVEEGSDVETVAAAAGYASEEVVKVGDISSLTRYRVAVAIERDEGFGASVTLPDTTTRGPFVVLFGHSVALAAEDSEMSAEKGSLVGRPVQFRFFPDPDVTDPAEAVASFHYEQAETIAA